MTAVASDGEDALMLGEKARVKFIEDVALVSHGVISLEEACARNHMSMDAFTQAIENERIAEEVNAEAAALKTDPRLARARSQALVDSALRSLADAVEAGSLSPATLVKVVEIAHRVSGAAVEQAQAAKRDPYANLPTINFVIEGLPFGVRVEAADVVEAAELAGDGGGNDAGA